MREAHQVIQEMDVTFTNVLEGVRQYFQGLPAGSGETGEGQPPSSGGASAPSPQAGGQAPYAAYDPLTRVQPDQNNSTYTAQTTDHLTNYQAQNARNNTYNWPEREKPQEVKAQHDQNYWTQDPKTIQNYHYPPNSYQYVRPETSYPNVVHQNINHRPQDVPNYQIKQPTESAYINGYPQRSQEVASKNYTTPKSTENMYMNGYSPYYPPKSTPTTQTYQNYPAYSTSYPTKVSESRTHNLPPIAALSSVNYHSKGAKVSAIQNRQSYSALPRTISSVAPTNTVASTAYSNAQQNRPSAIYTHTSRPNSVVQNSSGSQVRYTTNTEHMYQYPVASSTYSTSSSSSSSTSKVNYPSSYPYFQKPTKPETNQTSQNLRPTVNHVKDIATSNQRVLEAIKKRESPLDLSVKTVRTSADSTALDEAESERFAYRNRVDNKYMYHNVQTPLNGSSKDNQNMYQRNPIRNTNSGAPKVDFLPNFSASGLHNQNQERQLVQNYTRPQEIQYNATQNNAVRTSTQDYYRTNQVPVLNHQQNLRQNMLGASTYQINQNNDNKMESLPRFELPIDGNGYRKAYQQDVTRKRTASESQTVVPNKMQKVETWRLKIDQQIEQKLSSYDNSRTQEQNYKQNQFVKPNNQKPNYPNQYYQQGQMYKSTSQLHLESQSSTKNHPMPQYPDQYEIYHNPLHRSNSTSKLIPQKPNAPNNGGADKRVLSILRNSLEIKGAKEAQKKLEQMKPVNAQTGIQHPFTDVTAPLQPKPSIHSRHNVSPFTASSMERSSNTPPNYKFHIPRAIDSVKFETDTVMTMTKDDKTHTYPSGEVNIASNDSTHPIGANTGSESLDGLAAFLAARIRTKGERKQLTSNELLLLQQKSNIETEKAQLENLNVSSSPPKLNKEQPGMPSRRKLFGKTEDEQNIPAPINGGSQMPHRNTLRSSSETSVFDFRDSDSEGEMPVLERQSLEDMRRDRKSLNRVNQTPLVSDSMNNVNKNEEPEDPDWAEMCNKFCEQLQNNIGKKRGRRKRPLEGDDVVKLENVMNEPPVEEVENEVVIKQEIIDEADIKKEPEPVEIEVQKEIKKEIIEEEPKLQIEDDSDSDVPLTNIKRSIKKEQTQSEDEEPLIKKKEKIGAKTPLESSSDSDSDTETITQLKRKSKRNEEEKETKEKTKEKMVLRSADSSPVKKTPVAYLKKKALFGDGSDFHPGWEEEVYKYKRSIRMPVRLINVSRPHWQRMSTSLPDLDACSPAPSSLTDDTDFIINQRKQNNSLDSKQIKREILDSDSNSSFSFQKDEPSCSSNSKKVRNSISDLLLERVVRRKKRINKNKDNKIGPKIIEKSSHLLLATPSLGIGNESEKDNKKKGKIKQKEDETKEEKTNENSVYLGYFRKETVNNFREQFQKSGGLLGETFSNIVLKSRTRTETRVMKQRATIREVFGEDRPASAPPMTCHEEEQEEETKDTIIKEEKTVESETKDESKATPRIGLRSATSPVKKTYNLKRKYTFKNINHSETNSIASVDDIQIKSETPSVNGDETDNSTVPTKRKYKLTKMRRKCSSGFDYIRKKKKVIKKEGSEDGELKPKRRGFPTRQDPECEEDIQKEIKMWVMNKGVGETHLHRAARCGYADVTAYCLEKMDSYPSPKDNAGYTPLHEACSRGHLDIARILLLYGANVSESAQGGIRPLHEAAENGYVEIVRLLLSYGADPRLATYSGLTPLSLATDEETKNVLKNYICDMEGHPASPWAFRGPANCFDAENSGYNPLEDAPTPEPESDDSDFEFEISESPLPNLYTIKNEPPTDQWILLQDLSAILKIKSRDALLKQINPVSGTPSSTVSKTLIKEMKFNDFIENARCCTLLCAGEKVNARSSKIALVKYTDKVKKLLGVEKFTVPNR